MSKNYHEILDNLIPISLKSSSSNQVIINETYKNNLCHINFRCCIVLPWYFSSNGRFVREQTWVLGCLENIDPKRKKS